MRIINSRDIMETIEMLTAENLDVRTVTMGISLLDCIDPDADKACEKIYNKITRLAGNLVSVVDGISAEYGIPIVNKRISVTPIAMLLGAAPDADPVQYAKTLDRAAKAVGVNFIGGFGALVHKGFSAGDKRLIAAIPRALAETDIVCSSVNIGSTKSGINMDAVKLMGEVVRETAELTKDNMCMGDAKLVVFCNAPEDNPFMAGAFHGAGEPDCEIHVGVSGPGAVRAALAKLPKDAPMDEVAELVKRTAFKITRLGQLVANLASERLGVPAGIIDLSLAPTPAIGDSVANILEEMGLESCGCCGTTACLALLNDAVKKGGVMASNHVGGLSGAFIPVSEDDGMINAANCGSLTLDTASHEVRTGDVQVQLTRTEYAILKLLMQNSGQVLARVLDHLGAEYRVVDDAKVDVFADVQVTKLAVEALKENCVIYSMKERDESLESFYMNLIGGAHHV